MSGRESVNFIPHIRRHWSDPELLKTGFTNLIHESDAPEDQWIVTMTKNVGDWRSKSRSTYMRWALAINGMVLAESKYKGWQEDKRFQVFTIRPARGQRRAARIVLAEWTGKEAAKNYRAASNLIAAYGVGDLYGCLEEIIFEAYRIYLDHHPTKLLGGAEFKELRQFYYKAKRQPELQNEWQSRWNERVEHWQRKKAYDGLGSVFLSFVRNTELKKPHWYKLSTPETWAQTISGIGELRNLVTHGVGTVSKKLAEFSQTPQNAGFDFQEGKPLTVQLKHMMGVECFVDQLLTALNASLIERALGPQPALKMLFR